MSAIHNIDKFGRTQRRRVAEKKIEGLKLSREGNFDVQEKRLTNVGEPTDIKDSATVAYVDKTVKKATQNKATITYVDEALNKAIADNIVLVFGGRLVVVEEEIRKLNYNFKELSSNIIKVYSNKI